MPNTEPNRTKDQARHWHSGPTDEGQSAPSADSTADTQSIDLNHATWQQLMTVEGMDEPHAQAIVECRTHTGHFRTWEELQQAAGLTDELMSNLQHAARIGGTETIGGRDAENAPAREPERR